MNHEAAGMSCLREVYSAITELTGGRVSAERRLARAGRMEDPSPPLVPLPPPPPAVFSTCKEINSETILEGKNKDGYKKNDRLDEITWCASQVHKETGTKPCLCL